MIRNSRQTLLREIAVFSQSFCLIFVQLVAMLPLSAKAAPAKIKLATAPPAIQSNDNRYRADELILKFKNNLPATLRNQLANLYRKELKDLRGRHGGQKLKLNNGAAVTLDNVFEYVEPNFLVSGTGMVARGKAAQAAAKPPNDPGFAQQWGLANTGQNNGLPGADIRALAGWQKTKGNRDTIVAVIDTGIDARHPDLVNNLWVNRTEQRGRNNEDDDRNDYIDDLLGWNFVNDNANVKDDHGHGTAMAGIIGAEGDNRLGVVGVMQRVSLMPSSSLLL